MEIYNHSHQSRLFNPSRRSTWVSLSTKVGKSPLHFHKALKQTDQYYWNRFPCLKINTQNCTMWQRKSRPFTAQLLHLPLTGQCFTLLTILGQACTTFNIPLTKSLRHSHWFIWNYNWVQRPKCTGQWWSLFPNFTHVWSKMFKIPNFNKSKKNGSLDMALR